MVKKQITTTEIFDENGKLKKKVVEETYYDGDVLQVSQPIQPYVNGPSDGTSITKQHDLGLTWASCGTEFVPVAKL